MEDTCYLYTRNGRGPGNEMLPFGHTGTQRDVAQWISQGQKHEYTVMSLTRRA